MASLVENPDLQSALDIVRLADQPNGRINVDSWHLVRSDGDLETLRQVPGEFIVAIQLDDGPMTVEGNLVEATLHNRVLPGEGEFDLAGMVRAPRDTGTTAPFGVEVYSDALHELPAEEGARRAERVTWQVLEPAR
jgi:sugar phosphate isomerase/epimerase